MQSYGSFRLKDTSTEQAVRKKRRRKPKVYRTEAQLRQDLLNLIRANEGKPVTKVELARALGYQSPNTNGRVSSTIRSLLRDGVIRKHNSGEAYRYRYYLTGSEDQNQAVEDNVKLFAEKAKAVAEVSNPSTSDTDVVFDSVLEFLKDHEGSTPVTAYLKWVIRK